jgi:uncharacterized protein YbjT (DUF2867 family)
VILVCGATGFVGQALLPELARASEGAVRGLVRREFDAVRLRDLGIEAVTADLVEGRGLDGAVRGVETLVYLVHTLDRGGDVVAHDLEAVQNTMLAARGAGVRRVVFLGHVAASEEAAAPYLVARWAAELAVRQSGLEHVIVRAPLIAGEGAALFEVLRALVDRSPVVPLFGWRRTEVEPVALGDVVEALRMAALDPSLDGRTFEICGPERVRVGALLRRLARRRRRRLPRLFVPLPGEGALTTTALGWALARRPWRETRLLLETLREPQLCRDPSRRFPLPHRPLSPMAAL